MNGGTLILTEASSQRKYKRGERSLELWVRFIPLKKTRLVLVLCIIFNKQEI